VPEIIKTELGLTKLLQK